MRKSYAAKAFSCPQPVINESAVCMECKVKSCDPETGRLVGEIVSVDGSAMTDGKVVSHVGCNITAAD
ncbi:hypothetical protein [uncultured Gemmiger sp.]|uniref:hypothetical protein n=1 Tax=uncultured Gemmiger sp. TaxID=1623490 RepID=UPI0025E8EBF1|nr:hypothetical protein [uncultured Gemmiger sp.]